MSNIRIICTREKRKGGLSMEYKHYEEYDDSFGEYQKHEKMEEMKPEVEYDEYDEYGNYGSYEDYNKYEKHDGYGSEKKCGEYGGYGKYDEYGKSMKHDKHEGYEDYEEYSKHGMKKKEMVEVDKVLGMGKGEKVIEVCIPLTPPAFKILEELIEKKIVIDQKIAARGKVFINGRLIKNVPFKTATSTVRPTTGRVSRITFGSVRHATFESQFSLCINVPGSVKGAKVVVLEAKVESVEIPRHVPCGACEPVIPVGPNCPVRPILSLIEKDCIIVKVKVVKPMMASLPCDYSREE
jgi:hypothetical protein